MRPLTDAIPYCWEWGTLNPSASRESKPAWITGKNWAVARNRGHETRRAAILAAHEAIRRHERQMMEKMIAGLLSIPGLKLYGITDPRPSRIAARPSWSASKDTRRLNWQRSSANAAFLHGTEITMR